ncbi:MAG: DUF4114 domain-containing protein [Symploca sp. SIO2E9]|nr:DUF4114 domain-containing protein [Symploca sp. SIO2E9]
MALVTWTGSGDGISWNDAANWDINVVPSVSDEVIINTNVNVTTDVDITVVSLNLTAGTLTGTGNTTWSGNFTIEENSSVKFSGQTQAFGSGTSFQGLGLIELESGIFNVDEDLTINTKFINKSEVKIKTGKKLNLTGDSEIRGSFDLDEDASLELIGLTHTFAAGSDFLGLGTVDLVSGELNIDEEVSIKSKFKSQSNVKVKNKLKLEGDSEISGSFDLDEEASLELIGLTHTFAADSDFLGLGTVDLVSGELNIDEEVSIKSKFKSQSNVKVKNKLKLEGDSEISGSFDLDEEASLELIGLTHTFAAGSDFLGLGTVDLVSGELNIDEEVSIKSKFKSQSKVKVKNKLKLEGDSEISGSFDLDEEASLELIGLTHTFAAGSDFLGLGTVDLVSGELNIDEEVSIKSKFKSQSKVKVKNKLKLEGDSEISGSFDLDEEASLELIGLTHTFAAGSDFLGLGTVDLVSGELNIDEEVTIKSKFKSQSKVKVKNKLKLEGDSEISGSFDLDEDATVEFAEGTHILDTGTTFTGAGSVRLVGGTLTVNENINVEFFEVTGGTIEGAGTITANKQIQTIAINLDEGETEVISNQFLVVSSGDTSAEQIIYTLTDLPDEGILFLNGVAVEINSTFTQADINNGLLTYADGDSDASSDSFGFDVTANGELITSRSFNFTIGENLIAEFRNVDTAGIFAFEEISSSVKLKFSVDINSSPSFNSEMGVFLVDDDQGTIDGIAPGEPGYLQAALSRAQIISSVLSNPPNGFAQNSRLLEFTSSDRLGFYLVSQGTTDQVLSQVAAGETPDNVIFSTSTNLQVSNSTSTSFTLNWEEQPDGGDASFDDVVINLESVGTSPTPGAELQIISQGELLDLRSFEGEVSASFTVNREAEFNNRISFYVVQNEQGTILDELTGQLVNPEAQGYAEIAIRQSIEVELSVENQGTANIVTQLQGGEILAPFVIVNGSISDFLKTNPENLEDEGSNAYFAFEDANPDQVDHFAMLGDNTFGVEDLFGGGDNDFNDVTFKVDLTIP